MLAWAVLREADDANSSLTLGGGSGALLCFRQISVKYVQPIGMRTQLSNFKDFCKNGSGLKQR